MYENEDDLKCQRDTMETIFQTMMAPCPFIGHLLTYRERPTKPKTIDHDFDIFFREEHVGAVEIKCRNYASDFFIRNGLLCDRDKLAHLYKLDQNGIPGLLIQRASDGVVFGQYIAFLNENRDQWKPADEQMTANTDHGQRKRQSMKAYIIPCKLFTRIG